MVLLASVLQSPTPLCRIAASDAAVPSLLELLQKDDVKSSALPNAQQAQLTVKKLSLEVLLQVCVLPHIRPEADQEVADSRRCQALPVVLDLVKRMESDKFADLLLRFLLALKEKEGEENQHDRLLRANGGAKNKKRRSESIGGDQLGLLVRTVLKEFSSMLRGLWFSALQWVGKRELARYARRSPLLMYFTST